MREPARFSREDGEEALRLLKQIDRHGVTVYFYQDGRQFSQGGIGDNIGWFATFDANAETRRQASTLSFEAAEKKNRRGHVTGGRVFGYRNVDVSAGTDASGRPIRSHVEREIFEPEAAVVREIADRYINGEGLKRVAYALNAKGVAAPRAQRGRPAGWSQSTIRDVLRRPLYRGIVVWNRTKKRDASEKRRHTVKPAAEWRTTERPDLRIMAPAVADAIDARLAERVERGIGQRGKKTGAAGKGGATYLLTGGLLKCQCGGNFEVVSVYIRKGWSEKRYVCATRRRKGPTACANRVSIPVEAAERSVLSKLHGQVLEPSFVDYVCRLAFENRATNGSDRRPALEAERDELRSDLANLKLALKKAKSDEARDLLMEEFEPAAKRLKSVEQQIAILTEPADSATLRAALEQRIKGWRDVLRSKHKAECRFIVARLMAPITFDVPDYTERDAALAKLGIKHGDSRGTENIEREDCEYGEWTAFIKAGRLHRSLSQ